MGVSSVYEGFGKLFWNSIEGKILVFFLESILFVLGLMFGVLVIMLSVLVIMEVLNCSEEVFFLFVLVGGFFFIFGVWIGGGCMSGYGISGMVIMGLSLFISIVVMFGIGLIMGILFKV